MKNILFLIFIICNQINLYPIKNFLRFDSLAFQKNPLYIQEIGMYEIYKTKNTDIVLIGDSHTHGANWNELLGRNSVVERGITSDIIQGFYSRLNFVLKLNPKICFIMGGINDVYNWISVDTIIFYYSKIVRELKSKKVKVIIQSTLFAPKELNYSEDRNKEIEKLNLKLLELSKTESCEYLDLNKRMSFNNFLRSDLTNSWNHLNPKGYKVWAEEIEKILMKFGF